MAQLTGSMTIALARIAEEAEQRTGTLDLSDLRLETLPEALFALQYLSALNLGTSEPWEELAPRNWIDTQRERLSALPMLEVLEVAGRIQTGR